MTLLMKLLNSGNLVFGTSIDNGDEDLLERGRVGMMVGGGSDGVERENVSCAPVGRSKDVRDVLDDVGLSSSCASFEPAGLSNSPVPSRKLSETKRLVFFIWK